MDAPPPVRYRPAVPADLDPCCRLWKAGIDDYQARLNQPPMPGDLAPLRRLLEHMLATDAERFWVAARRDADPDQGDELVGFSSATVRGDLWFLAMLFVDPGRQSVGVGSGLMDRAQAGRDVPGDGTGVPGPDDPLDTGIRRWGMCTDSAQPVSNGLYARRGMIPRVPIWRLFGEVRRASALPEPPPGSEVVPFDAIAARDADGHRRLADVVDALDHETMGAPHGVDHAYLRREGRSGFLLRERSGGRPLGYAYGSAPGRIGPVAAVDPPLLPSLLGVAVRGAPPVGPVAVWVPGAAGEAVRALLEAGLRFDGFPGLICWSTPDHPFDRYLPISLAIV